MADLGGPRFGGERQLHGLFELAVATGLLDQDFGQSFGAKLGQPLDSEL
jgi:hypothetical protein